MPPGGPADGPVAPAALIDTHVHFHDCFDLRAFLEAASSNLGRAERRLGLEDGPPPARVLLVMEMETVAPRLLARLATVRETQSDLGWELETSEPGSAVLRHPDLGALALVEGRQIVTAERLELLATPCTVDIPDGLPITRALREVERHGAVPILPWGFGKWTGRRGRAVAALLDSWSPGRFLLADNGGRPRASWKPRLLTLAAQRGFTVVRGSDPLPQAADVRRVGSSGSLLRGGFDWTRPAASSRTLLRYLHQSPRSFGTGVGLVAFAVNQVHVRLRRGAG